MHFWLDNLIYIAGVVDKLSFPVAGFAGATVSYHWRETTPRYGYRAELADSRGRILIALKCIPEV